MRDRFLEVAAAFELLTDENARRDFDSREGRTSDRPQKRTRDERRRSTLH